MREYVAPQLKSDAFNCPNCTAWAHQYWRNVWIDHGGSVVNPYKLAASFCARCNNFALWAGNILIIPTGSGAPPASPDMPEEVATTYNEARGIFNLSPRGSAALLRLAIEQLCHHLLPSKPALNDAIAELAARTKRGEDNGIPPSIQKALDTVRVIGNHAVHPGEIQLNDDRPTAAKLFNLVNHIIEYTITIPNDLAATYADNVPATTQAAIEKRDNKPKS